MRHILFRGKRARTREWVTGGLHDSIVANSIFSYIQASNVSQSVRVLRLTVGQYIGLLDENDTPIYEGDIVHMDLGDTVVKGVVEYHGAAFYVSTVADLWDINDYHTIKVVGNIHDNPELLKEDNQ